MIRLLARPLSPSRYYYASNIVFVIFLTIVYVYRKKFGLLFNFGGSAYIFIGIMILPLILGWFLLPEKKRSTFSIILSEAAGLGIYMFYSFYEQIYRWALPVVIAGSIVAASLIIAGCCRTIRNRENEAKIRKKRVKASYGVILRIMGTVFACVIITVTISMSSDSFREKLNNAQADKYMESIRAEMYFGAEYSLKNKYDSISLFRTDESWKKADREEKEKAIQDLIWCESRYLGINHDMDLNVKPLPKNVVARYMESKNEVQFSSHYIDKLASRDVMTSTLHEVYHAYQFCMVKLYKDSPKDLRGLYVFKDMEEYISEFYIHYENGADDPEQFAKYYTQKTESDAREYSEESADQYYAEMDKIKAEKKKKDDDE